MNAENTKSTDQAPKSNRAGRVLLIGLLSALALILIIIASISILLSTSFGSRWALDRVATIISNDTTSLSYESTEGTLLWGMNLNRVRYSSDGNSVEIAQLNSRWNPLPLLYREFSLESLAIDGLRVNWSAPADEPAPDTTDEDPFASILPLPVSLQLNKVSLNDARINYADTLYQIDSLGFNATLEDNLLQVEELELSSFELADGLLDINVDLALELSRLFPLQGQIDWHYVGTLTEEINAANGRLSLNGDINSITIDHLLESPAQLQTTGSIYLGLAESTAAGDAAQLQMDLTHTLLQEELPLSALSGYRFEQLSLQTRGWIEQMDISGSGTISSETLSSMLVNLQTQLRDQQLFINSITVESASGSLSGSGLVGWESGIAVDFDYTLEEQNPAVYYTELPEGFDIGALSSAGNIRLRTENEELQGTFSIDKLEGQLNDYPLSASGTLAIDGEQFSIDGFSIQSGDNSITLAGTYTDNIDLQFEVNAPLIEQLYADAIGSIVASGSVTGTLEQPEIVVDAEAINLVFGDTGISQILVQGSYNNEQTNTLNLQVRDAVLGTAEDSLQVQSLKAELSGQPDNHRFNLDVASDYASLQMAAAGGLVDNIWNGTLRSGTIQSIAGDWQLSQPAAMLLSAQQVSAQQQCWRQAGGPEGSLCFNGQWSPDQISLQADLTDYPLAVLNSSEAVNAIAAAEVDVAPLPVAFAGMDLPAQLPVNMALNGLLNAQVQIDGALTENPADLQIRATLNTGEGTLFVATEAILDESTLAAISDDVTVTGDLPASGTLAQFNWPAAALNVERINNIWNATGNLEFSQQNVEDSGIAMRGSINTNLQMDAQENLSGQFDVAVDDLNFIEAFLPQLEQTQGQLNSRIRLNGTITEPQFSGDMLLTDAQTDIPVLGLQLRNLQATLSSTDGESLSLTGKAESGEGSLNFTSELINPLVETRELSVTLQGNDFQLADVEELTLAVSPDLQLMVSSAGIHATGTLLIPLLNVEITSLPETAVDVSGDTVLVSQRPDTPDVRNAAQADRGALGDMPLTAEIRLELGEDVRFSGFGLTAQLGGVLDINQRATGTPLTYGELSITSGSYTLYGQTLNIEHGKLLFFGTYDNPGLDIRAVREAENVKVGVQMNGTLRNIRSDLFSSPTLPDGEIIAVLVTGRPLSEVGQSDGNALVGAITTLGIRQGQSLTDQVRGQLGLDTLAIASSGDTSDSSLMLGKYLTPKIFVRYAVGLFDTQSVLAIDYSISERIKLEATSGQNQSIDLTYTRER